MVKLTIIQLFFSPRSCSNQNPSGMSPTRGGYWSTSSARTDDRPHYDKRGITRRNEQLSIFGNMTAHISSVSWVITSEVTEPNNRIWTQKAVTSVTAFDRVHGGSIRPILLPHQILIMSKSSESSKNSAQVVFVVIPRPAELERRPTDRHVDLPRSIGYEIDPSDMRRDFKCSFCLYSTR